MDPEWAMIWPKTCRRFVSSKRQPMPWRIYVEDVEDMGPRLATGRACALWLQRHCPIPPSWQVHGEKWSPAPEPWDCKKCHRLWIGYIYIYHIYILYYIHIYILYMIYILYIYYIYKLYIKYIIIIIVVIIIIYYYSLYTYSHTFWTHVTWNANKQINMQI